MNKAGGQNPVSFNFTYEKEDDTTSSISFYEVCRCPDDATDPRNKIEHFMTRLNEMAGQNRRQSGDWPDPESWLPVLEFSQFGI